MLFWLFVSCLAVPGFSDERPTAALEWQLLEAETAWAQGEPRIAESYYRAASREVWYLLAMLASVDGDLVAAERAFARSRNEAATELDRSRRALAWIQLAQGQVDEPVKELRMLAQEKRNDIQPRSEFIRGLIRSGKTEELAVELEQLRELDPSRAETLASLDASKALLTLHAETPEGRRLSSMSAADRERLRSRLLATSMRLDDNLTELQSRTGFRLIGFRPTGEESPAAKASTDVKPFGKLQLQQGSRAPAAKVKPPTLDAVALMSVVPGSLHSALESIDSGEIDRAEAWLRERLESVHAADARILLGLIAASQGHIEAAERELLLAVETPKALLARQALARLYWTTDRQAQAKDQLLQAAELGRLDRDLSLALADIEMEDKRLPAANRQLRSLDKRFDSVEALLRLAEISSSFNNHKQALDHLERALKLAPSSEQVLSLHVQKALQLDLASTASRSAEPLARLRPDLAEYQFFMGSVWAGLRKMGEASESLLRAVELDPDWVPAFLPLGLALLNESRVEESRDYLTRYLAANPENLEAMAGLAEAEERLDQVDSAEKRALGVLTIDPTHGRANLVIGMIHSGRGEFAQARERLQRSIDHNPLMTKAHYQLSFACARLGDRECARDHLEQYKEALQGPESTFVEMESAETGMTLLKKSPEDPES